MNGIVPYNKGDKKDMQLYGNKRGGKHTRKPQPSAPDPASEYDQYYTAPPEYVEEYVEPEPQPVEEPRYGIYEESDGRGTRSVKPKKKRKVGKTIFVTLLILAILAAAGYFLMEFFTEAPTVDENGLNEDIEPGVTNGRYNGMYTCLVVGRDKVGNNTDTIMVGCLDVVNKSLNVINIPRDTLINTDYNVKKINYIYPACVNNGKDAIGELKDAVKDMLGFGVDNYIVVDINAAAELVDCIGGVDFDVPVDMFYDDPGQDLHIEIAKGPQHLSGEQAVQVFRFRNTYAGGDIERIGVQQSLLKTMASQMLSLGNIPNIGSIIEILKNSVETDLTEENIMFYATKFMRVDKENINFMTLPGNTGGVIFGMSYVFPDIAAWIDMVNEYINPWEKRVTVDNVVMLTYADGAFYSTNGELPGGVNSFLFYSSSDPMAYSPTYQYYIVEEEQNADTE